MAHAAAGLLVPMLADPETRTRAVVGVALKRIGKAAVPALQHGAKSANADLRERCTTLLGQIAPGEPDAGQATTETAFMAAAPTPPPMPTPTPRRLPAQV